MPTILRRGRLRFYFFGHEPNEPPHVHVDGADGTCKIWLNDLTVARSDGLSGKELAAIVRHVAAQREALLEAWNGFFGTAPR